MEPTKEYLEGFNNGYILRAHSPELAQVMVQTLRGNTDYVQGMKDGSVQFEKEMDNEIFRWAEQHKENQQKVPKPNKEKDKGREYDDL